MQPETVKCCECNTLIKKKNIILSVVSEKFDPEYETILCGQCVKKQFGCEYYKFLKSLIS